MTDRIEEALPAAGPGLSGAASGDRPARRGLVAAGSLLGAVAASSCCVLPLVLTVMGVSGAWMANLRALAPYQPYFIALTVLVLGYGFYLVYAGPKRAAAESAACTRPLVPAAVVRGALWLALFVVAVAATFPYWFASIEPYLP